MKNILQALLSLHDYWGSLRSPRFHEKFSGRQFLYCIITGGLLEILDVLKIVPNI
jgi:hypothetical protein